MKPTYYILRHGEAGPYIHEREKVLDFAKQRAKELTLDTGLTHTVVRNVVMFEKPELIVTHYDEF